MKSEQPAPLELARVAEALTTLEIHWMQEPRDILVAPFRVDDEVKAIVTYTRRG